MRKLKIIAGLLIGLLVAAVLGVLCIRLVRLAESREEQAYYLGDPDWSGYVGVELTYDREPPDVTLVSPSGYCYGDPKSFFGSLRRASVYEIDPGRGTVTVMVDTDEKGGWTVKFARLSNSRIEYRFVTAPSPTLYIHGADEIASEDGRTFIRLTPSMDDGEHDACHYSVLLEKGSWSRTVASGDIPLNRESEIDLVLPSESYDGDEYSLRLTVSSPALTENGRPQAAHVFLKVLLQPREQAAPDGAAADGLQDIDSVEEEE